MGMWTCPLAAPHSQEHEKPWRASVLDSASALLLGHCLHQFGDMTFLNFSFLP